MMKEFSLETSWNSTKKLSIQSSHGHPDCMGGGGCAAYPGIQAAERKFRGIGKVHKKHY
jgi:hypothetical protein